MKEFLPEVFDVHVFDVEGTLITTLNTIKRNQLTLSSYKDDDKAGFLDINDASFDKNLFEFIGTKFKEDISDYDKMSQQNTNSLKILVGSNKYKNCKLILTNLAIDGNNSITNKIKIEIPKAKMLAGLSFINKSSSSVHGFDYRFILDSFDSDGNAYILSFE